MEEGARLDGTRTVTRWGLFYAMRCGSWFRHAQHAAAMAEVGGTGRDISGGRLTDGARPAVRRGRGVGRRG
jgi:hypothetical protein